MSYKKKNSTPLNPLKHTETMFKRGRELRASLIVDRRNQASLSRLENFGQDAAFPLDCRQNAEGPLSSAMNFSESEVKCVI